MDLDIASERRPGIDTGAFDIPDDFDDVHIPDIGKARRALGVAAINGHNRDLIHRLLIAQAIVEDMTLSTADPNLASSPTTTIDAARQTYLAVYLRLRFTCDMIVT